MSRKRLTRKYIGLFLAFILTFFVVHLASWNNIANAFQDRTLAQAEKVTKIEKNVIDFLNMFELLLKRSYLGAVEDARTAEETEIANNLWAISSENSNLIWRENEGKKQVLLVTWTAWDGYDNKENLPVELSRELWVSAAPEVKNFARTLSFEPAMLTLRMEQYLGLPPNNGKTKFIEMWVNTEDLFRPCPDAEINDTQCDLSFPTTVDAKHREWINNLQSKSYNKKNGYPWTRLGYTYDWGNPDSTVGASEFVIKPGAKATIKSVIPTEEYLKNN